MQLNLIVATDEDGAIGRSDSSFMWKLSDDIKHFKLLTMGFPVIMGHTTHASIGRLLAGRRNIILSRKKDLLIEGASVVSSIEQSLAEAAKYSDTAFIIGGGEVYRQFLPIADFLYITEVRGHVGGDIYFHYNVKEWKEIAKTEHVADRTNTHDFTIRTLKAARSGVHD